MLNHLLKISKRIYDDKFENAKGIPKPTCTSKILNKIINKQKTRSKMPFTYNYNDREITDPSEIAKNSVNNLYLASKLPESRILHETNLSNNRILETIFFKQVTASELKEIACKFKSGKVSGIDRIKIDDIKRNIDSLARGPHVAHN
mgnify:FL=1